MMGAPVSFRCDGQFHPQTAHRAPSPPVHLDAPDCAACRKACREANCGCVAVDPRCRPPTSSIACLLAAPSTALLLCARTLPAPGRHRTPSARHRSASSSLPAPGPQRRPRTLPTAVEQPPALSPPLPALPAPSRSTALCARSSRPLAAPPRPRRPDTAAFPPAHARLLLQRARRPSPAARR